MPMYTTIQPSFTGGEISPRMLARVDLSAYQKSAKAMVNAYPFTHGGGNRRDGTTYIGEVYTSSEDVRMIPFIYSKTSAYVLVFNNSTIQFITNRQFIMDGGSRYQITLPYTESEIPEVTYAQSGNLMFLAHQNHPPKQLKRITDTNWTLTDLPFICNAVSDYWYENAFLTFKIITSGDGHEVGDYYTVVVNADGTVTTSGPTDGSGGAAPSGSIVGTAANQDNIVVQTWTITCIVDETDREEWSISGSVSGTPTAQWDAGDYPKATAFYEQRLFFGGSNTYPQTIWGSSAGDYLNFTVGPNDNDGLNFTIASNRFDQIIHLESARQLLPLTYGGEFTMSGAAGGMTPSAVSIRAQTFHGTNNVKPIRIGQEILFVQKDSKKVRAISYDVTIDANNAPDVTLLAEHITGSGLIDGSYAQSPDAIAWYIREDGVLLSLTHVREQEVTGWARHTTDGQFKNVCAIPGGTGDDVYLVVERTVDQSTYKYVEVMTDTNTDANVLLTSGTKQTTWSGLSHLEGKTVSIVADGRVHPDTTISSGQITLQEGALSVEIGLSYTTRIELLHPEISLSDGTSQGRKLTVKEIVLRLQDTVGVLVNGIPQPVIQLPTTLDSAPVPVTEDKRVSLMGWQSPNNIVIEQPYPMNFTLLGVMLKVEVNQ